MSIAFRYFPYLVQKQVMEHMDLIDIFSIYSISKKSQTLARSYFNRHEFELHYGAKNEHFCIYRNFSQRDFPNDRYQVYIVPGIAFEVFKNLSMMREALDPLTIPFSDPEDTNESREKIMKFAKDMFPKLFLRVAFCTSILTEFLDLMNFARSSNVPIKRVDAGVYSEELVRAVMTQCSDVKNLQLYYICQTPFRYDFRTHAPLRFDFFGLICPTFATKDQLITPFMGCKKVILNAIRGIDYTDQELTEVCKQWLEAPGMQYLEIKKVRTFSRGITKLPGAVPVREVIADDGDVIDQRWRFSKGTCYMMKKADGTPAIVYQDKGRRICFRTDFKDAVIGEGS